MRTGRTAAVLISVLFCPAVFFLLWWAAPTAPAQSPVLLFGYPLLTAAYFLAASGIFRKKLGLRPVALWLWMLLPGYFLCWALLLLWQPQLMQNGFILFPMFFLACTQLPVWLVVWLGLWAAGSGRLPKAGAVKRFLLAAVRGAAPFLAAGMLLFAAAAINACLELRPAESYVDKGVHTFTASSGYPTTRQGHWQKKYHRYYERHVYVVIYKAPGGWRWEQDFLIEGEGKEAVRNRVQVERRVLSIAEENSYITVSPELTPQRYVEQKQQQYLSVAGVCLAVPAGEGVLWLLLRRKKAKSP